MFLSSGCVSTVSWVVLKTSLLYSRNFFKDQKKIIRKLQDFLHMKHLKILEYELPYTMMMTQESFTTAGDE